MNMMAKSHFILLQQKIKSDIHPLKKLILYNMNIMYYMYYVIYHRSLCQKRFANCFLQLFAFQKGFLSSWAATYLEPQL